MTPHAPGRVRRLSKLLAWIAPLACVLAAACCAARARADELIESAGLRMLRYARAQQLDASRTLRVNGLPLQILSGHTTDSVGALLDVFHDRCRHGGNEFVRLLPAAPSRRPALPARLLEPILRAGDEGGGYLGCLELGAEPPAPAELLQRVRAFAASADLSALGALRFVWAIRDRDGTAYVAVASEGPLPLDRIFPSHGDAPGVDVSGVPRPAASERILSAYQEDAAPMIVSYRAKQSETALHAQYRAALIDGGFVVREPRAPSAGARTLLAQRGDVQVAIVFTALAADASTATLLPLR